MTARNRLIVAAATAALAGGLAVGAPVVRADAVTSAANSPVTAVRPLSVSGKWIYSYKNPHATGRIRSYGKVQACFNVKGDHLYQGYTIDLLQRVGGVVGHDKILWSKEYWGAKHKTCTPWKSAGHDKVWVELWYDKFPHSHAAAQVWIYNP